MDAVKYGIQTLAPKFFGGPPDFVVSGSNIGSETDILISDEGYADPHQ